MSPPTSSSLRRHELVERLTGLTTPLDVVVIGGGATGLGVALDAAARGFSVALFEADDFAQGTSSRATKLVHGGVRYLAQGNVSLVREALRERAIILANAPHLASPLLLTAAPGLGVNVESEVPFASQSYINKIHSTDVIGRLS